MPYPYAYPNYANFTPPTVGLRGRVVNSESDINLSEVPMDMIVSYFPSSDGSTIFTRSWAQDGSIIAKRYTLDDGNAVNAAESVSSVDYEAKIKQLEKRIYNLERVTKSRKSYNNRTYQKKSVENNTN